MPIDYSKAKMYIIKNSINDTIYVGSTTLAYLCNRMARHRSCIPEGRTAPLYEAMRTLGVANFSISLHSVFPCKSKAEMEAEENRILNGFIAAGKSVYNSKINGKNSVEARKKMSAKLKALNRKGDKFHLFNFGSVFQTWAGTRIGSSAVLTRVKGERSPATNMVTGAPRP